MGMIFFSFTSQTMVGKGAACLRQAGIPVRSGHMLLLPGGCGYGLGVREEETKRAVRVLRDNDVAFVKLLKRSGKKWQVLSDDLSG